jgi:hypothetical protein
VSTAKAHAALDGARGVVLLCLIAAEEEEHLRPATDEQIRHGRIPMSALTKADGNRAPETRGRRRPNRPAACGG